MAITKDILQNISDRSRETVERICRDGAIGITDVIAAEYLASNPSLKNCFHQYCLAHHAAAEFDLSDPPGSLSLFVALASCLSPEIYDIAAFELKETLLRRGFITTENTNKVPPDLLSGLRDVNYPVRQRFIDIWRGNETIDYHAYNEYKALAESLAIGNAASAANTTPSAGGTDGKSRPSCSI